MAKRVRGQRSTHRPGGIGPARLEREPGAVRRPESDARRSVNASVDPSGLPVSAEPASAGASRLSPTGARAPVRPTGAATRDPRARTRLRSGGLQQRAAAEAGWVSEDLRRIGVISAIMLAGLALAWVLFVVVGLGGLY